MTSFPLNTLRIASGLDLGYRESGQGEAIVFLHGIGASSESWDEQLAHFAARRRAIAWDAPGYGGSGDLEPLAPGAGDYAEALAGFLDALRIERAALVGNSLGALMAAAFVRRWPARVSHLVLSDAASGHARLGEEERNEKLMQRLDDLAEFGAAGLARRRGPKLIGSGAAPGALARTVAVMSKIRPKGYAQAARMLSLADTLGELAGCRTPTLVICGSEDAVTPPETNRQMAAAVAGARFVLLDRIGHLPYVEIPERFNALVEEFVSAPAEVGP
jgi:pimeloyl-ACP methyl ester carboxylesterase